MGDGNGSDTLFHHTTSQSLSNVTEKADEFFEFVNNHLAATIGLPLVKPAKGVDTAELEKLLKNGADPQLGLDLIRNSQWGNSFDTVERVLGINGEAFSLLLGAGADPKPLVEWYVSEGAMERLQVLIALGAKVSEDNLAECRRISEGEEELED